MCLEKWNAEEKLPPAEIKIIKCQDGLAHKMNLIKCRVQCAFDVRAVAVSLCLFLWQCVSNISCRLQRTTSSLFFKNHSNCFNSINCICFSIHITTEWERRTHLSRKSISKTTAFCAFTCKVKLCVNEVHFWISVTFSLEIAEICCFGQKKSS